MLWRWLQDVPFDDPVERRLAPLLQVVITAVAVALAIAFVIAVFRVGLAGLPLPSIALAGLFWVALGMMVVLLRQGYFKLTSWLLLVIIFVAAMRRLLVADITTADEALTGFFLPLTIAGLLLGRGTLVFCLVLSCLVVILPSESEKLGSDTIIRFILNLALVGFLLDLFSNTLRGEFSVALIRNQELENAHQALKRSSTEVFKLNERLNITLRSIGDAVITTDADARILLVNDVAQRLTGWTQAEAIGQPLATVFNIINEYTREVVESPAERVLREGVVVGLANHTLLIAKDGREVPIDDSGAPIRESDDTIAGVVLVFRDITERKLAEEQEREMITAMERQHLARELHDSVTQSMFASTSLAELIPRIWEQDPQAAMGHLRQVVTINRGAMAEMRALLLELRPDAILNNSLRDLYQQLIDAAPARTEIDAKLIVIGEDRPLPPETHLALYRIAQESVNNILKHSRANSFRIELIYTEDDVRVTIEDDGQGFVTSETLAGLGLGSMRERAESIGASLELVSQLSQGTTVTIRWVNSSA